MKSVDPAPSLDPLLREGIDWIIRRASPSFSASDQAELVRWRTVSPAHDAAYQKAQAIGATMREVGREILAEQKGENVIALQRPALSRRAILTGAIAASAAGIFAASDGLKLLPGTQAAPDFVTAIGERRSIALADGLKLELDAKTSIALLRETRNTLELVNGRAEVIASLSADAAATILAGKGRIRAHAARFIIEKDDEKACVTCAQGTLDFAYGSTRLTLSAREQLTFSDTSVTRPILVDLQESRAWLNGQLIFRQTPLSDVVRQVNRYRDDGRVILANGAIGRRPVNGVFYTSKIDDAIPQIVQITGARATRLPGGVIILS